MGYDDIPDASFLIVFTSNVASLKQGIIKTLKNEVQAPYTILLVGETGVGKSAVLEFIANVLIGNSINQYDFKILDRDNEQGGSDNQSQTNSAHFYEFVSKSGIMVSASAMNVANGHNPYCLLRFVSLIRLDWPTLVVFSKMSSTRGVLQMR